MFFAKGERPLLLEDTYKNQACFLILSGPSLLKIDLKKLKQPGVVTFGINNSPKIIRPNLWTMVDDVKNFMMSIYLDPKIRKFIPMGKQTHTLFNNNNWKDTSITVDDCPNVAYYKRNNKFDDKTYLTEDTINWGSHKDFGGGRSVMLAAMRIIYLLGFNKVFLLGADFKMDRKKKYAFDQDRTKGAMRNNNNTYKKLNERFNLLRPLFEKSGFYVWNCYKDSGLKSFDYMPFETAVKIALKDFPDTKTERSGGMYDRKAKLKEEKAQGEQGVIYYNVGRKCLVRLAVSISSCRKHYKGNLTILCDKESYPHCRKIAKHFKTDVKVIDIEQLSKNTALLNKTLLHKSTPYEYTVYLDADTLVVYEFNRLFKRARQHEFVTVKFSDWTTKKSIMAKRVGEWGEIYPELTKQTLENQPALNTGVFAFNRKSELMKSWYDFALPGKEFFIPDELSCQLLVNKYKNYIMGPEWNTSCVYGEIYKKTRIIHFHGSKHCRINDGEYLYNCKLWYDEFDKVRHLGFVKDNVEHDGYLRKNIGFHDSNSGN